MVDSASAIAVGSTLDQGHVLRADIYGFPTLNPFFRSRIQLIQTLAAGGLYVVLLLHLKIGMKNRLQTHIGYVNLIPSITSAGSADIGPEASQIFLFLVDSTDKKHGLFCPSIVVLKNNHPIPAQHDSQNQHQKANRYIEIPADRIKPLGKGVLPTLVDFIFHILLSEHPEQHDRPGLRPGADVDGEHVHPAGDDALNQQGNSDADAGDDAARTESGRGRSFPALWQWGFIEIH